MAEGGRTATASSQPQNSQSGAVVAEAVLLRPWDEGVPGTILVRVLAFLPCRADRVHMACVNRHWHAAVTGTGLRRPPLPPQLPWLIFPSTDAPTFYSTIGRRFHRLCRLPPDVRRARFCGSGNGGWLLLALGSRHAHVLYNLNSGQRIPLPLELVTTRGAVFPLVVRAATLSAPPYRGHHMVAAIALLASRSTAAFWNVGRERWLSTGALLGVTPQDVIFHRGGFFFVTSDEQVISFWPLESPGGDLIVARMDYNMQQREDYDVDVLFFVTGLGTTRRYLVVSRGRLLMVVRYICDRGAATRFFRVFSFRVTAPMTDVELPRATWDDLGNELDGRMLFLGSGCSRSFEVAHYDEVRDQESMVFFLDESFHSVPSADGRRMYSFNDTGRYSMEERDAEPWPPEPRPARSDNAPPTWWFH